ncbi:hypothetical protein N5I28_22530, partial [Pseudomonas mosselii]|nr:hypothetical protein [Pseudomonas mosselii]
MPVTSLRKSCVRPPEVAQITGGACTGAAFASWNLIDLSIVSGGKPAIVRNSQNISLSQITNFALALASKRAIVQAT